MVSRLSTLLCLAVLLAGNASAKDKNKHTLPEYVLRAETVRVVIDPNAGEPLDQPNANASARESVEKALMEWGRYRPVLDGSVSDLVIVIRTGDGRSGRPTMKGGPIDQRPGIGQTTDDSARIGAQRGQAPPLTDPGMGPQDRSPHVSNEIGFTEDSFLVYRGNVDYPLDSPAVWRYVAKDCLRPQPKVAAVEEFRKAVADAEKPKVPKQP